jgi:Tfp pilus assembly protein PilE
MGQQQLLIVILVTIIVGISIGLAINAYDESRVRSNHEAVRQKMMEASTLAQSYHAKHSMYGGGNGSFSNIDLADLQITPDNNIGTFTISEASRNSFKLTAVPLAGEEINLVATITANNIVITEEAKEEAE